MNKFAKFCVGFVVVCFVFDAGFLVGLKRGANRDVPINTNQVTLEYAIGERVLVLDYTVGGKRELVQGVVTGWGLTDFRLTGKEEIRYFVSTNDEYSAHGYKADEVTRIKK